MMRNSRASLLLLTAVIVVIAIYFVVEARHKPEPKPLPDPDSVQMKSGDNVEPRWYIKFSVQDQKATYYTESSQAPASASSQGYYIGSGAVHPQYPLNAGGNARQPIIPFGTRLYLSRPVEIQGKSYDSLVVNDTGDVYYSLWRNYPYWVDVFAGTAGYYANKTALQAGVDRIDYYWYEPWK